jgi:hypothetical protein
MAEAGEIVVPFEMVGFRRHERGDGLGGELHGEKILSVSGG